MFPLALFASKTLLRPAPLLKYSSKVLDGDLANMEQLPFSCPLILCFYTKNPWSSDEFPSQNDRAFCEAFKMPSGDDVNKVSVLRTQCYVSAQKLHT